MIYEKYYAIKVQLKMHHITHHPAVEIDKILLQVELKNNLKKAANNVYFESIDSFKGVRYLYQRNIHL